MRTDRLVKEYEIQVQYCFFPLHPETPPEGKTLEELFRGRQLNLPMAQQQMAERMAAVGLDYGVRTHTYNSRRAQELARWVASEMPLHNFVLAMYRAYFVHGRNIHEIDVLLQVVRDCGLSTADAEHVLNTGSFQSAVDEDWRRCQRFGLTGVPAFVAGDHGVTGAQPYEILEQLVLGAGAQKRSDTT